MSSVAGIEEVGDLRARPELLAYLSGAIAPNLAGGGKFEEKPGDVRVDFTARVCLVTRDTCAGEPTQSFAYFTRHAGDRWLVYDYSAYDQPE